MRKNSLLINKLNENAVYECLKTSQNARIGYIKLKKEFIEKYKKQITTLSNTESIDERIIEAINSWAIPMLMYIFGIVKWFVKDLYSLDRLTIFTLTKVPLPNSFTKRLYLPDKEGGRGLTKVKRMCKIQESNMRDKLNWSIDGLMRMYYRSKHWIHTIKQS